MKIEFDDWLKIMNYWITTGQENGYYIYNLDKWDNEDIYSVITSLNKSDLFAEAVWWSEKDRC
ncbi:hypothetical protein [Paraclostridium bifermentans]|uniref:hypothetical protein n=1 Tax=Paraclostridium bifermentans TaxID=1490 RepID=UPI0018A0AFB8|nr:hypothetical protein [Paraclostridium bifermentans]